jgi:hypothetical protein
LDPLAGTKNMVPLSRVIAAPDELETVTVAVDDVRELGEYPIRRAIARTEDACVAVSKYASVYARSM